MFDWRTSTRHATQRSGIHPHDTAKAGPDDFRRLADLLAHPKVLAVGEIGLDYHYDFSPREVQKAAFIEQMSIAAAARKPIVIHTREAWDDTLRAAREALDAARAGRDHALLFRRSGGGASARSSWDFILSFGGILTFPKALEVQAAAKAAPADRILVETDAPYLAPVPKRGKRNEPALRGAHGAEAGGAARRTGGRGRAQTSENFVA